MDINQNTDIRFDFGKNWKDFSDKFLNEKFIIEAKDSVVDLLRGADLDINGKAVLDIGCGSGIFSFSFLLLGAKSVLGTDINQESIKASTKNRDIFGGKFGLGQEVSERLRFEVDDILNSRIKSKFDVVYSWGVLHHAGNLYKAIDRAAGLVDNGGYFIISVYNKHWSSFFWKGIKFLYNKSPSFLKKVFVWIFYGVIAAAKFVYTGRDPFKKERGMSFYYDIIDWLGGYPYEYARPQDIKKFVESRGFVIKKIILPKTPTGCNEFIFVKI